MNKTLPDKLRLALAIYFNGRNQVDLFNAKAALQKLRWFIEGTCTTDGKQAPTWDKEKEWDKVADVAKKLGFGVSSTGGTFWFTKGLNKKSYKQWSVDDNSFLTKGYVLLPLNNQK